MCFLFFFLIITRKFLKHTYSFKRIYIYINIYYIFKIADKIYHWGKYFPDNQNSGHPPVIRDEFFL